MPLCRITLHYITLHYTHPSAHLFAHRVAASLRNGHVSHRQTLGCRPDASDVGGVDQRRVQILRRHRGRARAFAGSRARQYLLAGTCLLHGHLSHRSHLPHQRLLPQVLEIWSFIHVQNENLFLFRLTHTRFFFNKHRVHKHTQPQIQEILSTLLSTPPASDFEIVNKI